MARRFKNKHQPYKRVDRVSDLLKREISQIIQVDMSDPRLTMATIVAVELTPDLKHAKVMVSILADENGQKECLKAFESGTGYIRRLLTQRLDLKSMPELHFIHDHSMERAQRLNEIFDDLAEKRNKVDIPELLAEWDNFKNCLIVAHEHPEGDAIGSTLALALLLEQEGKSVQVYNADPVPEVLRFLPGVDKISPEIPDINDFDTVFVLDCGDFERPGKAMSTTLAAHRNVINIDHHETNDRFGRLNIVLADASSTGEILFDIFNEAELEINEEVAQNLYTAIFTDVGGFQNAASSPKAFRSCAELVELSVDPPYIADRVYNSFPLRRQKLLGLALSTIRLDADDRIASMIISKEMLENTGTSPEDLEGFVDELRKVKGIEIALLLRENNEASIKTSMRSKGDLNVAVIAKEFGGGGHAGAAGCTIEEMSLDQARDFMIDRITAELDR